MKKLLTVVVLGFAILVGGVGTIALAYAGFILVTAMFGVLRVEQLAPPWSLIQLISATLAVVRQPPVDSFPWIGIGCLTQLIAYAAITLWRRTIADAGRVTDDG